MKVQTIPLLAIILLGLSLSSFAQNSETADEANVRQTIQSYFGAWINNDVESMKKVFQPKAKWFFVNKDFDLSEMSMSEVYANLQDNEKKGVKMKMLDPEMKISSIDITDDAAVAKLEINFKRSAEAKFVTEYLLLQKFPADWKIIAKTSSRGRLSELPISSSLKK